MRTALIPLAVTGILLAPPSLLAQARPAHAPPSWCTEPGRNVDSTFLIKQATAAVTDSVTKRLGIVFRVDDFQLIKTASLEQGVIISLVVARPIVRGGGGLVWVDTETACATVLKRYE